MPTSGQAKYINANINSFIALVFVGTFALATGLLIWHAAFGENPIATVFAANVYGADAQ